MARRIISKEEWKLFINEHTEKMLSLKAICKKYNLVYGTLYYGLIRKGVTPDTSLTSAFDRRHFDVKDDFFSVIDTEEKAYILGFLIADGSIDRKRGRITLKLKEEDKYMVEAVKNIIAPQYKLSKDSSNLKYLNGVDKTFISYRAEIKSDQLVSDLIALGVNPRKTSNEVLPLIDKRFEHHMIRGIFDGDGSISANTRGRFNLSICCTNKKFLEDIQAIVKGFVYTEKRPGLDMYRLVFTNKTTRQSFIDYIYKDATIYLKRKYSRACRYTNTVEILNDERTP